MSELAAAQARMARHGKSDLDEYCGMSCPKKWPCDAYVGAEHEVKLLGENERLREQLADYAKMLVDDGWSGQELEDALDRYDKVTAERDALRTALEDLLCELRVICGFR